MVSIKNQMNRKVSVFGAVFTFQIIALFLSMVGILAIDLLVPMGEAAIIAHVVIVTLTVYLPKVTQTLYAAFFGSGLIILGALPVSAEEIAFISVHRGLTIGAIWLSAYLIIRYKQAKETVEESESFEALFNASDDGLIVTNKWGEIIKVNSKINEIFGYTREEIVGSHLETLIPERYWQQYRDFKSDYYQSPRNISMGPVSAGEVLYATDKAGEEIPVNIGLGHFNQLDEILTIIYVRDIRVQLEADNRINEAQQWLTNFMESSPAYISVLDENLKIKDCNQAMLNVFNVKSKDDIIGKHISELYPKIEESAELQKYESVLKTGERIIYDQEVEHPLFGHKYFNIRIFKAGSGLGSIIEDVTSEKMAAKKVSESRDRLTNFIDATNSYITILDENLKVIDCNKPILKMFNVRSKEEVIGRPLTALSPEIATSGQLEYYEKVLETKQPLEYEQEVDHPLIGHKFFNVRLFKADGGVGSIIDDVTDKRLAQEENRQYAAIVANSTDRMALLDKEMNYIVVNQAYAEAFGKEKGDFIGTNKANSYGQKIFNNLIKPHAEKCLKGEQVHFHGWVNYPEAGNRFIEFNYSPYYKKNGELAGFVSNTEDKTEQKIAEDKVRDNEKRLQNFLDSMPVGVYILDREFKPIYSNKYATEKLGISTSPEALQDLKEDINSYDIRKMYPSYIVGTEEPYPIERLKKFDERVKSGETVVYSDREVEIEGKRIPLRLTCSPILNNDNELEYIIYVGEDISDRLQAEKDLRESEKRLTEFMQSLPLGVYVMDNNAKPIYANKQSFEILGQDIFPDIIPEELSKIYHAYRAGTEKLYPSEELPILKAVNGKKSYTEDIEIHRNGEIIPLAITGFPVKDEDGNVKYGISVFEDISEKNEAKRKLLDSEKRLQNILDSMPVGVYVMDSKAKPLYANERSKEILGRGIAPDASPEELPEVYQAYKAGTDEIYPHEEMPYFIGTQGKQSKKEDIEIEKDDKRIPLTVYGGPVLDKDGNIEFVVNVFEDITERRVAEKLLNESFDQLQSIMDSTQDAIVTANSEGYIEIFNPAAEKIFGYSQDEIYGKSLTTLMPEKYKERHDKGFARYKETGEAKLIGKGPVEMEGKRKDGKEFPLELTLSSWHDDGNRFFTAIIRDMTEKKKIEKKLEEHEI